MPQARIAGSHLPMAICGPRPQCDPTRLSVEDGARAEKAAWPHKTGPSGSREKDQDLPWRPFLQVRHHVIGLQHSLVTLEERRVLKGIELP